MSSARTSSSTRSRRSRGEPSPRVGLALGAGSAAAMAEIGAIEVLRDAGIPIHCVAGSSAGAVVGAAYASGKISELRECLAGLSRSGVMRLFDLAWPREGFLHGRRALDLIRPQLGERIETLALPFAAVATDLRSGQEVQITRGPVFDAVRASVAFPGIFRPWRIGGRLLVDGGLVNPVPVSACRALGADFVIAINVLPLVDERESMAAALDTPRSSSSEHGEPVGDVDSTEGGVGLIEVVARASRILSMRIAMSRLREEPPAHLLQISRSDVGMFDVHRTRELAELGRRAAQDALAELRDSLGRFASAAGRRSAPEQREAS
jgi:NTE family protein